ncbi:MAG: aminotransferase class I/II-fold pyridoxal phosphate-dependent enzyme [Bacteroidota bacterium]
MDNDFRQDNVMKGAGALRKAQRVEKVHFGSMSFNTGISGQLDSNKYTLFNLMADDKANELSFGQRIAMINSWITDMDANKHWLYKRELVDGCRTEPQVKKGAGEARSMINLGSNDYLNLAQHPRIKAAAIQAIYEAGLGSGGSPMLSGTLSTHRKLERKLAQVKGCEDAAVFTSGFSANTGVISALMGRNDAAIYDRYAHASLMDGSHGTNRLFFSHNDVDSLKFILEKNRHKYNNKLVILDGVYSMDGDIARLDEILEVAHHYHAWVLVDEAHATGVLGANGHGTTEHFNVRGKVDIITGTLSKAIGSVGGYVAGSKSLIQFLGPVSRPYMFSTAPLTASSAAALEALNVIEEEPQIRAKLWENIHFMQSALNNMGFNLGDAETAILPLILGDDYKVKQMATRLDAAGIFVNPVPYPAVPRRLSRVRLSLTAGLTQEQLTYSLAQIKRIGEELDVI